MRRRVHMISVAAVALTLLGTSFAPAAHAAEEEIVTGLGMPLSLAVGDDGTVYVASYTEMGGGLLTMAAPGHDPEPIYADEGGREVGALSVDGHVVTFATTSWEPPGALLYTYEHTPEGWVQTEVGDLYAHEAGTNPDGGQKYGIVGLSRACKKEFTRDVKWMLPYKGHVDSHPYSSATMGGTTYVGDAGANAVFAVSGGEVTTAAVLPPTKVTVSRKIRRTFGLPKCAQGHVFKVEAVPTDVEVGPDGNLYVTTLPGGPEDPAMGANGAIYQVNPGTGAVTLLGGGFVSPTGLAITPTGTAYVSMLFAGLVMEVPFGGAPAPFAEIAAGPADVDYHDGFVYVADSGLMGDSSGGPIGRVVRFPVD